MMLLNYNIEKIFAQKTKRQVLDKWSYNSGIEELLYMVLSISAAVGLFWMPLAAFHIPLFVLGGISFISFCFAVGEGKAHRSFMPLTLLTVGLALLFARRKSDFSKINSVEQAEFYKIYVQEEYNDVMQSLGAQRKKVIGIADKLASGSLASEPVVQILMGKLSEQRTKLEQLYKDTEGKFAAVLGKIETKITEIADACAIRDVCQGFITVEDTEILINVADQRIKNLDEICQEWLNEIDYAREAAKESLPEMLEVYSATGVN
jgi:hypothetical protein